MNVEQLRELLNHLNDPSYTGELSALRELGLEAASPTDIRRALTLLIEALHPQGDVPEDSLAWRFYRLLTMRYLDGATQFEVADALGVSIRHLARLQNQALRLLTVLVDKPSYGALPQGADSDDARADLRQSQVEREVSSLYRETQAAEHDLGDIVQNAAELVLPMALDKDVTLRVERATTPCMAVIPRTVVSQAVLSAITYAVKGMLRGQVHIITENSEQAVMVRIRAMPHVGPCPREPWLVRELLEPVNGRADCQYDGQALDLTLTLEALPRFRVLVIDDNRDMLRFYHRCVIGTPFDIIDLRDGSVALDTARNDLPDIIVLDLMLPNIDGWELLTQFTNDPLTRHIPLIVCSVVDESELARSLGAVASIVKPVDRQSFREALYRALEIVEAEYR